MQDELQQVLDFVEGRLAPEAFEQALMENPKFEELLSSTQVTFSAEEVDTTTYLYVIGLDLRNIGDVLNAQDALQKHLEAAGVPYVATKQYGETYDLLLKSQPKWIDCVDPSFLRDQILPHAKAGTRAEKERQLRELFLELFRYAKDPPDWIQGGEWPIEDGMPLFFLGQMEVSAPEYFHDCGSAYLFLNPKTRKTRVVIQLY